MISEPYELVIVGKTSKGREFRPSDWAERLSGILSSFASGQKKLAYAPFVRPVLIDDIRCVTVDKQLERIDPRVYAFLMSFARDNDLQVVDSTSSTTQETPPGVLPNPAAQRRVG